MLAPAQRLTTAEQFRRVVRRGRRGGATHVVLHLLLADGPDAAVERDAPVRAGFVVSKAVGGSVVRNRVKRRLRHLVRERLTLLPPGAMLVVRALPPASEAGSAQLAGDLDRVLTKVLRAQPVRASR